MEKGRGDCPNAGMRLFFELNDLAVVPSRAASYKIFSKNLHPSSYNRSRSYNNHTISSVHIRRKKSMFKKAMIAASAALCLGLGAGQIKAAKASWQIKNYKESKRFAKRSATFKYQLPVFKGKSKAIKTITTTITSSSPRLLSTSTASRQSSAPATTTPAPATSATFMARLTRSKVASACPFGR